MFGYETFRCPNCDQGFEVRAAHLPLRFIEREADAHNPKSLVVVGRDRLIHSCPLKDRSSSAVVNQAQEMISVQADCTVDEALALMRDRATVEHRTVNDIAEAVIKRSIRFGP